MDLIEGFLLARTIARTGQYRNWRGVETELQQLGHADAELWFATLTFRSEIEALCAHHYKRAS